MCVGAGVGLAVMEAPGVGSAVGIGAVGASVGNAVGALVGSTVGATVGDAEGRGVGAAVGLGVGSAPSTPPPAINPKITTSSSQIDRVMVTGRSIQANYGAFRSHSSTRHSISHGSSNHTAIQLKRERRFFLR